MAAATVSKHAQHQGQWEISGLGDFVFYTCGTCAVTWGIPRTLVDLRKHDHEWWHCPNGHKWCFTGDNEEQKLRKQLAEAEHQREVARDREARERAKRDQAEASLRATKGHVTRLKKRAVAGVCPAGCKRHFSDLERHMASKHPDHLEKGTIA